MVPLQFSRQTLTSDPFLNRLQSVAQEVEGILEIILPPPTTRLHEAMRYSVLGGGKRLRAFLVVESCQLFNVSHEDALRVAAAVELIQAYSLVHDDLPCMDNAGIRRGKPSCHKAFGEATATLTGDALIPLAFQVLASLKTSPEKRLTLIESLAHTIGSEGLVAGQMMDLGQERPCQNFEDLWQLQCLKTSVFFGFSAEAGAILGGAHEREREALKTYGLLFGQAFQMMDDWLDGCGKADMMGKPNNQDTEKMTFLSLLGPDLLYTRVEATLQEAAQKLVPFKEKALFLQEVAKYILTREK